jgi:hypothetical protein
MGSHGNTPTLSQHPGSILLEHVVIQMMFDHLASS